jgi:hypothetical protein
MGSAVQSRSIDVLSGPAAPTGSRASAKLLGSLIHEPPPISVSRRTRERSWRERDREHGSVRTGPPIGIQAICRPLGRLVRIRLPSAREAARARSREGPSSAAERARPAAQKTCSGEQPLAGRAAPTVARASGGAIGAPLICRISSTVDMRV